MAFSRILRSSALMGGASVVAMVTGLLRGKLVAVVLGPAGVGMMGLLNHLITALTQILGFGLGNSAVKYAAGVEGEERNQREAVVYAFALKLAILGGLISLVVSVPVCLVTFGGFDNLSFVMAASLAAPLAIISMALGALLQARGTVSAVAKVQIYSAVGAFVVGVPLIFAFGMWGLVGALIISTIAPFVAFRGFIRLRFPGFQGALKTSVGTGPLVRMGLALIGTIIVAQISAYLTRIAVLHGLGLDQAGYYQAAFSIAGSIPGFIFAAMGTDFYPRVAAAKDEMEALEVTERQIKAGVVLATPCFFGMILFSPLLLTAFYSNQFLEAQGLLRWMIWGVACRLVSWPLGYWLLARATPQQLFWLEGVGAILTMALTFALVPSLGLLGAGIAFVLGASIYGLIMILFIRRRIGRGISAESLRWCGVAMVMLAIAQYLALRDWSSWFSAAALVVVSVLSGTVYYLAMKNDTHA